MLTLYTPVIFWNSSIVKQTYILEGQKDKKSSGLGTFCVLLQFSAELSSLVFLTPPLDYLLRDNKLMSINESLSLDFTVQ